MDAYDRAYARLWIDHVTKRVVPAFMRLMQGQSKETQDEARKDLYEALRQIAEKRLGPHFLGEQFSLVDVAIAPWVMRDYVLVEHRGYKRSEVSEAWVEWAGILEKRDSVLRTMSVRVNNLHSETSLANESECVGEAILCGHLRSLPQRRGAE